MRGLRAWLPRVGATLVMVATAAVVNLAGVGASGAAAAVHRVAPATAPNSSWNGRFGQPGLNIGVEAVGVSGSKVYAGGTFTGIEGVPSGYNHIAEWTGTGWVPLGTGLNGPVYAIATAGSMIYVGGSFSQAGGTPVSNVAAWNGNSWSAVPGGVAASGTVYSMAYAGGVLYVGGERFLRRQRHRSG